MILIRINHKQSDLLQPVDHCKFNIIIFGALIQTKFVCISVYFVNRTIEILKDSFQKVDALLQKGIDIPSTSSCNCTSSSALKQYLSQIKQIHNDFMATYCKIFDQLSKTNLKGLFDENAEKLVKFKVMKQSLGGKIRSTQTKIKQLKKLNDAVLDSLPFEMENIQQNASIVSKNVGLTDQSDVYSFSHSERMKNALMNTFGSKTFRPNQLQAINSTLLGHDSVYYLMIFRRKRVPNLRRHF